MDRWLLLRSALRSLLLRRLRSALAVASVTLALFALVAIHAAGVTLVEAQRRTYVSTGQPDIVASVPGLNDSLLAALRRRPGVLAAEGRVVQQSRLNTGSRWIATRLVGIERFDGLQLDRPELVEGRWPGSGEVVLDASARRLLGLRLGDLVAFQANPADPIWYARVSGFAWVPARPDATLLNQLTAYAPARDLRRIFQIDGDNTLLVKVERPALAGDIARELRSFLAARQMTSYGWVVRDPTSFLGSRELQTLLVLLRAFAVLGSLVAAFIVAHTTAGIVAEEQPTIGTLRALGATRWQIALPILTVQATLGLVGSLFGLLLGLAGGYALSAWLARLAGLLLPPLSLPPTTLALGLASGVSIATLGAAGPILVRTWSPAARLQHEAGIQRVTLPRWLTAVTARLAERSPFLGLCLRDPFRRPLRLALTVAASTVALAALLASQTVDRSLRDAIDTLYARYRADAWFLTNPPTLPTYARHLAAVPVVRHAEPWLLTQGAIAAVRTDVWGVPRDTAVYRPHLVAGTWLLPTEPPAAVVTANLARKLAIAVGDVLPLDLAERRIPVRVVGIVDDESTYLGATALGKVFIDRGELARLLGQDGRVSLYALQFWEQVPTAAASALAHLEQRERALRPLTLLMAEDRAATERVLAVLTVLARTVVFVIGLAAILGIANALLLDVTERRREFGVLRTLGTSQRRLMALLVGYGTVVLGLGSLAALPLGLALGLWVLRLISVRLFMVPLHLDPWLLMLVVLAVVASTATSVLAPALVVARIRPVEVLRYE